MAEYKYVSNKKEDNHFEGVCDYIEADGWAKLLVEQSEKTGFWYLPEECPHYTPEEKEAMERQRKDLMTLTPADVERALYKAKGMDFEDLKQLIATGTGIDLKAFAIEFRAKDFYRGAKFGNSRLFDVVGALLGYTSDDIDYLFENKELPV